MRSEEIFKQYGFGNLVICVEDIVYKPSSVLVNYWILGLGSQQVRVNRSSSVRPRLDVDSRNAFGGTAVFPICIFDDFKLSFTQNECIFTIVIPNRYSIKRRLLLSFTAVHRAAESSRLRVKRLLALWSSYVYYSHQISPRWKVDRVTITAPGLDGCVDEVVISDRQLRMQGWFVFHGGDGELIVEIHSAAGIWSCPLAPSVVRSDVNHALNLPLDFKSGFFADGVSIPTLKGEIRLLVKDVSQHSSLVESIHFDLTEFNSPMAKLAENIRESIFLGRATLKQKNVNTAIAYVKSSLTNGPETKDRGVSLKLREIFSSRDGGRRSPNRFIGRPKHIDIVIPCYGRHDLVRSLLLDIVKHTDVNYRIFAFDDCSPDDRVWNELNKFVQTNSDVKCYIFRNEQNLGFVSTVNRGFSLSKNDVVILNTDTRLPSQWASRLMRRIWSDRSVASVTPMTNSGTIASFPNWLVDNDMLTEDVNEVDHFFRRNGSIDPLIVPTGVGFCMALARSFINKVGLFDSDAFKKGYGEENDWCQRATKLGGQNLLIPDLFVYHMHGASFGASKAELAAAGYQALVHKHPSYEQQVHRLIAADQFRLLRFATLFDFALEESRSVLFIVDHDIGGGTNSFSEQIFTDSTGGGRLVVLFRVNPSNLSVVVRLGVGQRSFAFQLDRPGDILLLMRRAASQKNTIELLVNHLIGYNDIPGFVDEIIEIKHKISLLKYYFHDYYAICPSYTLIDNEGKYCGIPPLSKCLLCSTEHPRMAGLKFKDISSWREEFYRIISVCNDVVVFSDSGKQIVERAFGPLDNLRVIPHTPAWLGDLRDRKRAHSVLMGERVRAPVRRVRVGLLGGINVDKGRDVLEAAIRRLDEICDNSISFVVIGNLHPIFESSRLKVFGEYNRSQLFDIVVEEDIDVFWLPSIWPETYAFTCDEVMAMGYPLVCGDIGAMPERVAQYPLGRIVRLDDFDSLFRAFFELTNLKY